MNEFSEPRADAGPPSDAPDDWRRFGFGMGGLVALITALSALGQFATSIYVPSLPSIARALGADAVVVQMTLTIFLVAFALGQLVVGPLSDRFGRRPVFHAGLAIFSLATLACALADDVTMLLAARALQGIGACACQVCARATVRDLFEGSGMTRVMAVIGMAFSMVPTLAPLLGGVIEQHLGWRATFGMALLLGLFLWALLGWRGQETNLHRSHSVALMATLRSYGPIIGSREFLAHAVPVGAMTAAIFSFLAGSAVLFIQILGVAPDLFGIFPALTLPGSLLGGMIARRLAGQEREVFGFHLGLGIGVAGSLGVLAVPVLGSSDVYSYTAAMVVFVTGLGIAMPFGISGAIRPFGRMAGTATALAGFLQMVGAASGAAVVGVLIYQPRYAIGIAMTGFSLLAIILALALSGRPRRDIALG